MRILIYQNDSSRAAEELQRQRLGDYGYMAGEQVYTCSSCGSDICCGEDCLISGDGVFCRSCIMMMTSEDVVELLGYSFVTAENEE